MLNRTLAARDKVVEQALVGYEEGEVEQLRTLLWKIVTAEQPASASPIQAGASWAQARRQRVVLAVRHSLLHPDDLRAMPSSSTR